VIERIRAKTASLVGNNYDVTQPIEMRFNELIGGVRSDVAVKIFGDDMAQLEKSAQAVAAMLQKIPGASEVKVEQTTGLPMLTVQIDREKASRYGLNMGDVQDAISTAFGGREAGTVFEGDRRFAIQVRLPEAMRSDVDGIGRLPIALPRGGDGRLGFVPLSSVATVELAPGPNQVSREDGKRRIVVSANVRGRDIGSFVAQAQQELQPTLRLQQAGREGQARFGRPREGERVQCINQCGAMRAAKSMRRSRGAHLRVANVP
jgi:cobalt-zinc-cadmium resistance protein CzcA